MLANEDPCSPIPPIGTLLPIVDHVLQNNIFEFDEVRGEVEQLKREVKSLRRENEDLAKKVDDLHRRSKRNNIINTYQDE
ncbi:hypothetical protein ACOMHN_047987 [Nucella lapillus]